jgi:hypothetical protein
LGVTISFSALGLIHHNQQSATYNKESEPLSTQRRNRCGFCPGDIAWLKRGKLRFYAQKLGKLSELQEDQSVKKEFSHFSTELFTRIVENELKI